MFCSFISPSYSCLFPPSQTVVIFSLISLFSASHFVFILFFSLLAAHSFFLLMFLFIRFIGQINSLLFQFELFSFVHYKLQHTVLTRCWRICCIPCWHRKLNGKNPDCALLEMHQTRETEPDSCTIHRFRALNAWQIPEATSDDLSLFHHEGFFFLRGG